MSLPEEKYALELLGLPRNARARLAARLIASLDEDEDDDVEAAWIQESQKRLSEVEDIETDCVPAEKALNDLRARYS